MDYIRAFLRVEICGFGGWTIAVFACVLVDASSCCQNKSDVGFHCISDESSEAVIRYPMSTR
jgi:hypothetical protein